MRRANPFGVPSSLTVRSGPERLAGLRYVGGKRSPGSPGGGLMDETPDGGISFGVGAAILGQDLPAGLVTGTLIEEWQRLYCHLVQYDYL